MTSTGLYQLSYDPGDGKITPRHDSRGETLMATLEHIRSELYVIIGLLQNINFDIDRVWALGQWSFSYSLITLYLAHHLQDATYHA